MEPVLLIDFECPSGWESCIEAIIWGTQHAEEDQTADEVDRGFGRLCRSTVLLIIVLATTNVIC